MPGCGGWQTPSRQARYRRRSIIVVGASAGGGLAAATVLRARDLGGPTLAGQLLMCPMLDDRNDTVSAIQMTGVGIWDRSSNALGWRVLLGDECGGPNLSPYGAPARETDLSGLPPTFIDVGSAETFRVECVSYASRIWAAGGQAELHVRAGGFPGYSGVAPKSALSHDTQAARSAWVRRQHGTVEREQVGVIAPSLIPADRWRSDVEARATTTPSSPGGDDRAPGAAPWSPRAGQKIAHSPTLGARDAADASHDDIKGFV